MSDEPDEERYNRLLREVLQVARPSAPHTSLDKTPAPQLSFRDGPRETCKACDHPITGYAYLTPDGEKLCWSCAEWGIEMHVWPVGTVLKMLRPKPPAGLWWVL